VSRDEHPEHHAVEGPEETLEPAREQAHEEPGLHARAAALEARERELLDRLARMQADFDNFRRRTREESVQAAARGKESLLKALLPLLDNLDRALAHTDDAGLKAIARQLAATLAEQGVIVLDPAGEAFDARWHEAVAQEPREGAKPGTIVAVLEKGYALDGRVLRPARVVVASG
jgi:molecular chaperone GrpE